jgi:hypothetical protein
MLQPQPSLTSPLAGHPNSTIPSLKETSSNSPLFPPCPTHSHLLQREGEINDTGRTHQPLAAKEAVGREEESICQAFLDARM